jgi:hypothetical protein
MEKLFWPDLFIVGGGISKKSDKYIPLLEDRNACRPRSIPERGGHRRRGAGGEDELTLPINTQQKADTLPAFLFIFIPSSLSSVVIIPRNGR